MTNRVAAGFVIACVLSCGPLSAQFRDDFNGPVIAGWEYRPGDGTATMEFRQGDGYGTVFVDATKDRRGIWWAYIARTVSPALDLAKLAQPGHELRVEARIRVSHAPSRVNLHVNTPKTESHANLMEFDIPDTETWHTISMTTHGFKAGPGDIVNAQLALFDWGLSKYFVDIDYFKVDVVEAAKAGPDLGEPLPYRPPLADPKSFTEVLPVSQDSMVDLQYPDMNFNKWYVDDNGAKIPALTVSGTQFPILRWDLKKYAGRKAAGSGLLELTTHSLARTGIDLQDFGGVRVTEILRGAEDWDQRTVTLDNWCQQQPLDQVINTQMIIDVDVTETKGGKTFATISRPVLQRLLDGRTKGIVLRPLGAIGATFYASEYDGGKLAPKLYFNLQK